MRLGIGDCFFSDGAHRFLAFQAASTVASCSGVSAKRGALRRASGTVGHQARVSRTVVAIGRKPSPAAFARELLIAVWPKLFPVGSTHGTMPSILCSARKS